jgi:acetyl-CoA C-acetyltransferase
VNSVSEAERLANDPYFHRALPLDEISAGALQAVALENAVPEARDLALAVVAKNRRNGALAYPSVSSGTPDPAAMIASPVKSWPLREAMIAAPVTGAVALVLASEDFIAERGYEQVAWLRGMGWATEASFLGDRDLSQAPALNAARTRAYADAGITDAIGAIDVAEVTDATPYQELMAYEGLGLCARDRWGARLSAGDFEPGGTMPVNPSGGALCINPVFCSGLIRIAEAATQVLGRAREHQIPNARTAVAHAASGFAMQYQTVVVLGGKPARSN